MSGILYWARRDLRHRRAAAFGLAVLVAVAAVVPLTAAAAARRTDSSLARMREELRPYHVDVQFEGAEPAPADALERIRSLPGVEAAGLGAVAFVRPVGSGLEFGESFAQGPRSPEVGRDLDRIRVKDGRLPLAADEALLSPTLAARIGLGPGDRLELETFTWDGLFAAFEGMSRDYDGPRVELHVAGIGETPEAVTGSDALNAPAIVLGGGFFEEWDGEVAFFDDIVLARLEAGPAGNDDFAHLVRDEFPDRQDVSVRVTQETSRIDDAVSSQAFSLALLAVVSAVAGVVAVAGALSRHARASGRDQEAMASLGVEARRIGAARVLAAAPPVVIGAAVAATAAVAASTWFPTGPAGRVEPDPGMDVDPVVLAAGAVAILALLVLAAGRRQARSLGLPRRSRLVSWLVAGSAPAPIVAGVRAALVPWSSRGRAPVRSASFAAVAGTAGVVAALLFGTALGRLVDTPERWGFGFDVAVAVGDELSDAEALDSARRLLDEPLVESALLARINNVVIEGTEQFAYGLTPVKGHLDLSIVSGRGTQGPGEVVLGGKTLTTLGVAVGDALRADGADGRAIDLRVVGQALFPTVENEDPAQGVGMTLETYEALERIDEGFPDLYIRFAPGAAREDALAALDEIGFVSTGSRPAVVENLRGVATIPYALAGFLAVLALVAVVHALLTSVRRRRRDLAVWRALGSTRRQVATMILVQSLTFAVVGLVAGVPLGTILGRQAWRVVADARGFAADLVVAPWAWALVPGVLVFSLLVAAGPARSATRMRPLEMLRSE